MRNTKRKTVLITGGAGFIGSNLAARLLATDACHVRILDNLSRPGVERNVRWLEGLDGGEKLELVKGDVRSAGAVRKAVSGVEAVFHLAAQVAVTRSIDNPREDFEINALGTLNVLEAARECAVKPFVLFTSTNKVYGSLPYLSLRSSATRNELVHDLEGIDEETRLDFHSPYGCSKGAADQYVRDYARIFNIPAVVFRMSCICGPRQFGTEDQGWVAHFVYSALEENLITIYGDGKQVRDVLHVDDLINAFLYVWQEAGATAGKVYNVGGGKSRAISLLEMLAAIERVCGKEVRTQFLDVRPGDQPFYVSNSSKLQRDTKWEPCRSLSDVIRSIARFWDSNREDLAQYRMAPASCEQEVA